MTTAYPRGSEWRKWDLHIHSPINRIKNQFNNDWKAYASALNEADIAVIGLTNYFCFSKDEIEKSRKLLAANEFSGTVLPNLEFRISVENKEGNYINIHALFSENILTKDINRAFEKLELTNTEADGGRLYCADEDLQRAGLDYEKILVDFKQLTDCIDKHFVYNKDVILIACPRGYGNFRPQTGDGRGTQLAIEIDKKVSALFGDTGDREFFLNKPKERYKGSLEKPVYRCSDAHEISHVAQKYTWIKADPTFQGLLQTLYEPEERVRIQEENPITDFKNPHFSSLSISGAAMEGGSPVFAKKIIPLNPSMITMVGGRGAGKSVILDCLYKLFNISESLEDPRLTKIRPEHFILTYTKSDYEEIEYKFDEDANLDYLHVRQGDIKGIANDPRKLADSIKNLLGLSLAREKPNYDYEIASIISRIDKSSAWLKLEDSEGNRINDKNRNKRILKSNRSLVETITTEGNRDSIEIYQGNSRDINNRTASIKKLLELKVKISTSGVELRREIEDINKLELNDRVIPQIDFSAVDTEIDLTIQALQLKIQEFKAKNIEIENTFKDQGIDQDVGGLLRKIDQYQKEINLAHERVAEHDVKLAEIQQDILKRSSLVDQIVSDLQGQSDSIVESYSEISNGKESWTDEQKKLISRLLVDIKINAEIDFDVDAFYEGLTLLLNGQKFRSTNSESQLSRIKNKLRIHTYDNFISLLKNEPIIDNGDGSLLTLNEFAAQNEYFLKENFNIYEYLYLFTYRDKYLSVKPVIEYLGKSPEKLSVGQRGTFYVCMKLATDPFGSPFVFDQPEDDLDNKFIMKELVPIFRLIKKYRQVIIATHNANLVVNADAEQIIIADNETESLSYESGSIENTSKEEPRGIREKACDILEGGQLAFESREKKYGFEN